MKSFQVNTRGIPAVKKLLVELYHKHVGVSLFNDGSYDATLVDYLQFWMIPNELRDGNSGITHSHHPYQPLNLPTITIDETIDRITTYKKLEPVLFVLNTEYSAAIYPHTGKVKVGSHEFTAQTILNLAKEVQKALDIK